MDSEKAKVYDAKHGKDAYHYRYTKAGHGQSKAYEALFHGDNKASKSKAIHAKMGEKKMVKISHKGDIGHQITDHKGRVLSEHNWPK